jgi:hypothetical protein
VPHRPDGIEEALRLAREVEQAQAHLRDEEAAVAAEEAALAKRKAALAKLRADAEDKRRRFEQIVRSGACAPDCKDPRHGHSAKPTTTNGAGSLPDGLPADWRDLSYKWRLAWLLFLDPVLDYDREGVRLYGESGQKAKDKVNAIMSDLRKNGLVEKASGLRHYRIRLTRAQLAARSGTKEGERMPP